MLLNGRRLPNSGLGADASVDLNTLPMSFIERVEVLAGGASAAVGADAVGGVVNIVTRRNNRGLELSGTRTITERGDGEIVTGQAAIGFDLLGGTWSLGVDYVEQDGVTMDRRSYSALPLIIVDGNGTVKPDGLNNLPVDGVIEVPEGNALGLEPGVYTRVPGATGQTSADYRPYVRSTDGFNPAPFNYSQTPNERAALWLLGSRPLGESTNLFLEAFVHHRESAQQAAPAFFSPGLVAPMLADGSPAIPADNYYNPFGVDVPCYVRRRLVEAGNRRTEQEVDLWRALIGLEGSVARWTWEVALQSAKAEATGVEKGFVALSRLAPALGPSGLDDSGRIVCGSPDPATGRVPAASIIPDCVPLNLFGGAGSITEEQLAYVMSAGPDQSRHERAADRGVRPERPGWADAGQGRAVGAGCRLPARSRQPGAGSAARLPNADSLFGLGRPDDVAAERHYDARELFAEVQVPLLHDRPWARDMALNIGLRWSDFSSFDQHTSWQAGLRWQPAEELTLRANYAEVFRAPTIAELYEPAPCVSRATLTSIPAEMIRRPRSKRTVRPTAYRVARTYRETIGFTVPLWRQPGARAGDGAQLRRRPDLHARCGPRGFPQASIISRWSSPTTSGKRLPTKCCSSARSVAPARLAKTIRRFPDGSVSQVATFTDNFGGLEVRGVDFAIDWSAMTRLGEVNSRLLATYLDRWDDAAVSRRRGVFIRGQFRCRRPAALARVGTPRLALRALDGQLRGRIHRQLLGTCRTTGGSFGIDFDPFDRRVDPVLYHDIEAGFKFDSGVTVRAAITNVTDEDPPYLNIAPANTDVATYRLLGRSYFLELRYQVE